MKESRITKKIKNHFKFFLRDHGFSIAYQKDLPSWRDWIVILTSDGCKIMLYRDRTDIFLDIGPYDPSMNFEDTPWYGVDVIVYYLSQGKERVKQELRSEDEQLKMFSDALFPYCDQIMNLFCEEFSVEVKQKLDEIKEKFEQDIWNSLLGE